MRSLARSRVMLGLLVCCAILFGVMVAMVTAPDTPTPAPAAPALVDQAPPAAAHGVGLGLLITVAGLAALLAMMANASTVAGTSDGRWETAANWSNGAPTSVLSAILSSTSGVMVLPERTSATTKNLSGTGKIGICGGGVNTLNIVAPSANTALKFVAVDHIEDKSATSSIPRGHN